MSARGPLPQRRVPLPPEARARFDRMRRVTATEPMAKKLGVSVSTIHSLEHGGVAKPETIAKVAKALGEECAPCTEGGR